MKKIWSFIVIGLMLSACGGGSSSKKPNPDTFTPEAKPDTEKLIGNSALDTSSILNSSRLAISSAEEKFAQEILAETNKFRAANGLSPLTLDTSSLAAYAGLRAEESSKLFSHTRPNNQKFSDHVFIHVDSSQPYSVGENLYEYNATGHSAFIDPKHVVQKWIESKGHRANLLGNYKTLGVGYYKVGNKQFATQIFGNNAKSIYKFTNPVTDADFRTTLADEISYDADNKIKYKSNKHILQFNNGQQIVLKSRTYSGTAVLMEDSLPLAYATFGKVHTPVENFRATYKGDVAGDLGQRDSVTGNFDASIDGKSMVLSVNSRTNTDLVTKKAVIGSRDLSFQDNLSWNSANKRYESTTGSARLFGDGSEMAGQFDRITTHGQFRGVYSGVKQ